MPSHTDALPCPQVPGKSRLDPKRNSQWSTTARASACQHSGRRANPRASRPYSRGAGVVVRQKDGLTTFEITPRAGARFHLFAKMAPHRPGIPGLNYERLPLTRFAASTLVCLEWRNFWYSDDDTPDKHTQQDPGEARPRLSAPVGEEARAPLHPRLEPFLAGCGGRRGYAGLQPALQVAVLKRRGALRWARPEPAVRPPAERCRASSFGTGEWSA